MELRILVKDNGTEIIYIREVKISQRERERQCNIATVLLRFCTTKDERIISSISSSTTTITNRTPGRTQENDDVSTEKFCSRTRCRCRSEILTSLLPSFCILP